MQGGGFRGYKPTVLNIQQACFSPNKSRAAALMDGKSLQRIWDILIQRIREGSAG